MDSATLGIIIALITIVGTIVKIVMDYAKVKGRVEALEKEDKDIRLDLGKDIKSVEEKCSDEFQRLRDDIKADREYTHASFVKLSSEQNETANVLREVSITLQTFQTNIDQRLSSLERKIDSITTIKIADK